MACLSDGRRRTPRPRCTQWRAKDDGSGASVHADTSGSYCPGPSVSCRLGPTSVGVVRSARARSLLGRQPRLVRALLPYGYDDSLARMRWPHDRRRFGSRRIRGPTRDGSSSLPERLSPVDARQIDGRVAVELGVRDGRRHASRLRECSRDGRLFLRTFCRWIDLGVRSAEGGREPRRDRGRRT